MNGLACGLHKIDLTMYSCILLSYNHEKLIIIKKVECKKVLNLDSMESTAASVIYSFVTIAFAKAFHGTERDGTAGLVNAKQNLQRKIEVPSWMHYSKCSSGHERLLRLFEDFSNYWCCK